MADFEATHLEYVFKVTERCNLACPYCYFFFKGDTSYKTHPPVVRSDVVEALGHFVKTSGLALGHTSTAIVLHGGEPLLMKKAAFDRMCTTLRSIVEPALDLRIALQTNGVLIDADWIDLFARHDIHVGVSIDGTPDVHDTSRLDHKGRGTYAATERGWWLLHAAGEAGRIVRPGILCVVNPDVDGYEQFIGLADRLQCRTIDFLVPDLTHDDPLFTPDYVQATAHYLMGVIRGWGERAENRISLRFLNDIIHPLLDRDALASAMLHKENYRNLITVSSDGSIGPEDTLRTLAPRFRTLGLNVRDHAIQDVIDHPVWQELLEARRAPDACDGCRWWGMCQGGKLYSRFAEPDGFAHASGYCDGLKTLYAFVSDLLERAARARPSLARIRDISPLAAVDA